MVITNDIYQREKKGIKRFITIDKLGTMQKSFRLVGLSFWNITNG